MNATWLQVQAVNFYLTENEMRTKNIDLSAVEVELKKKNYFSNYEFKLALFSAN